MKPSSPPRNNPPAAKKVYAAISPKVVGFRSDVRSGIGSKPGYFQAAQCMPLIVDRQTKFAQVELEEREN
jgi:hypothetical protein